MYHLNPLLEQLNFNHEIPVASGSCGYRCLPEDSDSEEQDTEDAMRTSTGRDPLLRPGQKPLGASAAMPQDSNLSISKGVFHVFESAAANNSGPPELLRLIETAVSSSL